MLFRARLLLRGSPWTSTLIVQPRVDVHDVRLPRLLHTLLVFLRLRVLDSFLLELRPLGLLELRKYSPWLQTHGDRGIYPTQRSLSTRASQELLASFQFIMGIVNFYVFSWTTLLCDIDKGEFSPFLYWRVISFVHWP